MKQFGILLSGLLSTSLLFFASGCGDEGTDPSDTDAPVDNDWLERQETPEGEFTPADVEGVLDGIVDALNETEQRTDIKLAVISKVMSDYFQIASMGGNRAVTELGAIGTVTAADQYDEVEDAIAAQVGIVETLLEENYQGIAISPFTDDLLDSIDTAVEADSVVVTFDSDVAESKRHFYLGTDNRSSGRTAGETLVELLGENTGTVIVLGHESTDWVGGYERTDGAVETLEAAGLTVVVVQVDWTDPQINVDAMAAAADGADPPVVGLMGMFSNSHTCVEAAEEAGIIEDVKIVTFDFEVDTLQYMQDGKIQATHAQRQYYMGYLAPYIMYAVNALGLDETTALLEDITVADGILDTGIDVVHADKVDDYNDFLDELGILN